MVIPAIFFSGSCSRKYFALHFQRWTVCWSTQLISLRPRYMSIQSKSIYVKLQTWHIFDHNHRKSLYRSQITPSRNCGAPRLERQVRLRAYLSVIFVENLLTFIVQVKSNSIKLIERKTRAITVSIFHVPLLVAWISWSTRLISGKRSQQAIWSKIIIYISKSNTTYYIRSAIVSIAKIILISYPPP